MRSTPLARVLAIAVTIAIATPAAGHAQIFKKLKETVQTAAEDEVLSQADRLAREGVQCPFNDFECIRGAQESGDDYYLTDESGEMITDAEGAPVTDPGEAAAIVGAPPPAAGGGGAVPPPPGAAGAPPPADFSTAYSNYDFLPGDRVLVDEDYARDNVGDFPRLFSLVQGSFEVIEWQGERYVRALSGGSFAIPLPGTLPDQFTVEYAVNLQHGNAYARLTTGRAYFGQPRDYSGSAVSIEFARAGIRPSGAGPEALASIDHKIVKDAITPVRVMADGEHMKIYLGEERVANVPNAVFPRSDTLYVSVGWATPEHPILVGGFRIAAGGLDLYDRLAADGRVATQGIHFDVNSATIRPESSGTLEEIGTMLQEHPDLRIAIEGHTDSDGDEAANQELSERRAASVKDYLVANYGIAAGRLESAGYGESKPVAPNDTAEGKQQNRRVELVRL